VRLIVLGPPGAGKGTQAAHLAADLGVAHIATGDLFRSMAQQDSPLADRLRSFMDRGLLVPDDLTNEVLEHRLAEPDGAAGFVLDGYPRTVQQAHELDRVLARTGVALDKALRFMVTGAEIVARLAGRLICPTCGTAYHVVSRPPKVGGICDLDGTPLIHRPDDQEETVLRRLAVYGEQTKPLYELYAARGILVDVDAIGTPAEVYERVRAALGAEVPR
jgi:adenylate kinase